VGAMERKATTHVGSWLSLSCVPSPAKQVLRLLIHSLPFKCLSGLCILNLFLFWNMLKVAHVFSCLCVKPL
jgi:hypothetical protein